MLLDSEDESKMPVDSRGGYSFYVQRFVEILVILDRYPPSIK